VNWTKEKRDEPPLVHSTSTGKLLNLAIELLSAGAADVTNHPLHPYFGGGLRYSYTEYNTQYRSTEIYLQGYSQVTRFLSLEGFGGAAFWMSDRFSFFGEVGLSVGDDPSLDGRNFNLSSLSRLGLNFLF
jgi:hypothetical protein